MPDMRKYTASLGKIVEREGAQGLTATVVQLPENILEHLTHEQLQDRYLGVPLLLDQPTAIIALHFDPYGTMDEHEADHDIIFIVVQGNGFVRMGGEEGTDIEVRNGDAVHWPPDIAHKAWAGDDGMTGIAIEYAE